MPTNVSPEYKKAQEQYRRAREPADRLKHLREMLSTIPKHKGTEALQADIKTRIKELTEELAGPRKGAARTGPAQVVRPEGAAQIALVGPPNAGKSSLHRALTGSRAEVGAYPFTTRAVLPGMFLHRDVPFQIVDLPAVAADAMEPWLPNALQPAHAALLLLDLREPGCAENLVGVRERLDQRRIALTGDWPGGLPVGLVPDGWPQEDGAAAAGSAAARAGESGGEAGAALADDGPGRAGDADGDGDGEGAGGSAGDGDGDEPLDDPFRITLPTLLVLTKADLGVDPDEVQALFELTGARLPALAVSAERGLGLDRLGELLMRGLRIVRVYTKVPGKPADRSQPYTLFGGDTVEDLARLIHRDLAASLRHARIWGGAKFDGQQVGRDHPLADGDVVEIHA